MNIKNLSHYYGDIVRIIFIITGIIMLLGMSTVGLEFGIPAGYSILIIVILGIAAGFTNPVLKSSLVLNVAVSLAGLAFFTYFSYLSFQMSLQGNMELINKILAILFLIASYLSIKSLRGYLISQIED